MLDKLLALPENSIFENALLDFKAKSSRDKKNLENRFNHTMHTFVELFTEKKSK